MCTPAAIGDELVATVAAAVRARVKGSLGGEPFTAGSIRRLHRCAQPGSDAFEASPLRDVLFVVLASSTTVDRVRALRETWASQLVIGVNLLIIGDADIPGDGVDMTTLPELAGHGERGHAGHRTLRAIIFAAQDTRYKDFPWLFAVDDDTFVNLAPMPALLSGWDVRLPMLLSFIWDSPDFNRGRTWPSGGAGMLLTQGAVRIFAEALYSPRCPFDGENDLSLGLCAWQMGVALVHSPLFDPEADALAAASTWTRNKNDATVRTLITIHRASGGRMQELFAAVQKHGADNALALSEPWLQASPPPPRTIVVPTFAAPLHAAATSALPSGVVSVYPPEGARFLAIPFPGTEGRGGGAPEEGLFPVHLSWSGPTLSAIYRRNVRSFVLQHRGRKGTAVVIWSNDLLESELSAPELADLRALAGTSGPFIVRYQLDKLLVSPAASGAASAPGLDLAAFFARSPGTHVHLHDVLRLAIIWRFGGAYVDLDMVSLRPLDSIEGARSRGVFAANDRSYQYPCLELTGNSGHALPGRMLTAGLALYEKGGRNRYGPLGAPLLLSVLRAMSSVERGALAPQWNRDSLCDTLSGTIEPSSGAWRHVPNAHMAPQGDASAALERVREAMSRCTVVHLYGGGGGGGEAAMLGPTSLLAIMYAKIEEALAT